MRQGAPEVRADTPLAIEFAAAHEEIAFWVGADIFAFLVVELGTANRAVVPPVVFQILLAERRRRSIFQ
jgi:hypothetical protein